jgi:thioredoxin
MLSRVLLTLTLCTMLVPGSLFAEDDSSHADKFWIVIGSNNVMFAMNQVETQKLIDESKELLLLVSCSKYQLKSVRSDGQPQMQLECEDVTVITADDDDPDGQKIVTAGKMSYDSAKQTLDLSDKIKLQTRSRTGQELSLEAESLRLNLSDNDLKMEVSGAKVRLESKHSNSFTLKTASRSSALFFTSKWCGPCQQMQPVIYALRRAGYSIESVNVEGSSELVKQYGITTIPQLVVLDGQTVREHVTGIRSLAELKRILGRAGSSPALPPIHVPAESEAASKIELRKLDVTTPYLAPALWFVQPKLFPIIPTRPNRAGGAPPALESDTVEVPAVCPACQQRMQESMKTYQPLIPELFFAPSRDSASSDSDRTFSIGWVGIER